MWKTPISMLGVLLLGSISARAVETPAELQESFSLEARLLDDAISDYGRARSVEKQSITQLRCLSDDLDKALEDPNVSLSYLRGLEDELGRARDDACTLAANTAAFREAMYDQMQRLGEISRRFERATGELSTTEAAIEGTWQALELAAGRPSSGDWTARRVSSAHQANLDD